MELRNCVIVEACRTAVGSMGGGLKPVSAYDMACCVMKGILDRSGIDPKEIDEVEAELGRLNIKRRTPTFLEYVRRRKSIVEKCINGKRRAGADTSEEEGLLRGYEEILEGYRETE